MENIYTIKKTNLLKAKASTIQFILQYSKSFKVIESPQIGKMQVFIN